MAERHLFIFGLGYSALAFARRAASRFATIAGTVRSAEKAAQLRRQGIDALLFEQDGAAIEAALARTSDLVQSIAPDAGGDPALERYRDAVRAAPALAWIGYLSTVGVYGDQDGGWVDEDGPVNAVSDRARRRVLAEADWAALGAERGVPVAILRLAGIYGPGRNPFVNLAGGTARRIVKPGQVFNRIHVDDIAAVLEAAADRRAGGIFNVADDEPAPPQDVVAFAAALAGYPPLPDVPFETAALSPMARSFYADNKRVANRRLARDLGVRLAYPTYREALTALWRDGSWREEGG